VIGHDVGVNWHHRERLRLIAATVLSAEALLILVVAVVGLAVDGYDSAVFAPLVIAAVVVLLAWLGLSWPGSVGVCLVLIAFFGFVGVALGGPESLALWWLALCLWSVVPLICGLLFLVAKGRSATHTSLNSERQS
jgi:hypothetical protein